MDKENSVSYGNQILKPSQGHNKVLQSHKSPFNYDKMSKKLVDYSTAAASIVNDESRNVIFQKQISN